MNHWLEATTLSVFVARAPQAVYDFISPPEHFPKWASGLCDAIERFGGEWLAQTPYGPMKVRFTEPNRFGVLDHWVLSEGGAETYVPMRVIANGTGSEVLLTLFRQPEMSAEKFHEDARWVERDLQALKAVLEA